MIEKLRQRILDFINSDKDTPVLAGLAIGFYLMLFYYSKNFALANSLIQFLFLTAYYVLVPIVVLYGGYKLLPLLKMENYRKNYLFVVMPVLFFYYIFELITLPFTEKGTLLVLLFVGWFLSKKLRKYYKLFIVLMFFLSLFNLKPLIRITVTALKSDNSWKEQTDNIEQIQFKKKPNIYYIQPDGYVSFNSLKDTIYNFDNTVFEGFLENNGFKLYDNFHSNYFSTLLSNSSMFSMRHHYIQPNIEKYAAREIIISNNAVLRIMKNNDYKTHFITEKPYLIVNRPAMGYDYCNIPYAELPFIKDGWHFDYDVLPVLKEKIKQNGPSGNYYTIEKFLPGHIHGYESDSNGTEKEKEAYIDALKKANAWLTETISYINEADPNGIIVIAADHGGFAGFKYTLQSLEKTQNKDLVYSIYGAMLAIKWNGSEKPYDTELRSSVNLFRSLFSYLAEDDSFIAGSQDNSSYIKLLNPDGTYKYINDKGEVVFEKLNDVQD